MKKNNKKGFTLVELLAVIVLLALVAVVGANLIIARLNTAKKDTFANTFLGVKKELTAKLISGEFEAIAGQDACGTKNPPDPGYELLDEDCAKAFDISPNDFELRINKDGGVYKIELYAKLGGSYSNIKWNGDPVLSSTTGSGDYLKYTKKLGLDYNQIGYSGMLCDKRSGGTIECTSCAGACTPGGSFTCSANRLVIVGTLAY